MGVPQRNKTQKFAFDKKKVVRCSTKIHKELCKCFAASASENAPQRNGFALFRVITNRFLPEKFPKDN
jgi:hypothetical protein